MVTVNTYGEYYDAISRNEPEIKLNFIFNKDEYTKFRNAESISEIKSLNVFTVYMLTGRVNLGTRCEFITNMRLKLENNKIIKRYFPLAYKYESNYAVKETDYSGEKHRGYAILVRK